MADLLIHLPFLPAGVPIRAVFELHSAQITPYNVVMVLSVEVFRQLTKNNWQAGLCFLEHYNNATGINGMYIRDENPNRILIVPMDSVAPENLVFDPGNQVPRLHARAQQLLPFVQRPMVQTADIHVAAQDMVSQGYIFNNHGQGVTFEDAINRDIARYIEFHGQNHHHQGDYEALFDAYFRPAVSVVQDHLLGNDLAHNPDAADLYNAAREQHHLADAARHVDNHNHPPGQRAVAAPSGNVAGLQQRMAAYVRPAPRGSVAGLRQRMAATSGDKYGRPVARNDGVNHRVADEFAPVEGRNGVVQANVDADEPLNVDAANQEAGGRAAGPANTARIPRPPNAFIGFRKDYHEEVKAANPGIHNNDISKIIGAMWHSASAEVRARYARKAEIAKAEHERLHPDYKYKPRKSAEKKRRMTNKKRAAALAVAKASHAEALAREGELQNEIDNLPNGVHNPVNFVLEDGARMYLQPQVTFGVEPAFAPQYNNAFYDQYASLPNQPEYMAMLAQEFQNNANLEAQFNVRIMEEGNDVFDEPPPGVWDI